jgi:hypothetical protein
MLTLFAGGMFLPIHFFAEIESCCCRLTDDRNRWRHVVTDLMQALQRTGLTQDIWNA